MTLLQLNSDTTNYGDIEEESSEDSLIAYTVAVAIARMACADCTNNNENTDSKSVIILSPSFLRKALFDLITLCCSRVSEQAKNFEFSNQYKNRNDFTNFNSQQNKKIKSTNENENFDTNLFSQISASNFGEVKKHFIPKPNFNSLLILLLNFIAKKRGYENSTQLLLDHSRCLLSLWLGCNNINNNNNNNNNNSNKNNNDNNNNRDYNDDNYYDDDNNDNNNNNNSNNNNNNNNNYNNNNNNNYNNNNINTILALHQFPWKILSPGSQTYRDFLTDFSSMIIAIICEVEAPRERWRLLLCT